jgi:mannosyltransferase OCH1-like enzyme
VHVIPPKFHWVWVLERPLPGEYHDYIDGWLAMNPGWQGEVWYEEPLGFEDVRMQADIARYRILASEGGVALDTDFQALRPLGSLLLPLRAFSALQKPSHVAIGVMGCEPGHPFFKDLYHESTAAGLTSGKASALTGPGLMTRTWARRGDITLFPPEMFYPYAWDDEEEMEMAPQMTDVEMRAAWRRAYGVHHWAHARKHFQGSKGRDGA